MTPARMRRLAAGAACAVALTACAETTVDPVEATVPVTSATIPSGPTALLLDRLVAEVAALSERVVDNEGDDEALARVEALWAVAGPEVAANRPELAPDFGAALELVRRSVERRRPADADKATINLRLLIAAYQS